MRPEYFYFSSILLFGVGVSGVFLSSRAGTATFDAILGAAPVCLLLSVVALVIARDLRVLFLFLLAITFRWLMVLYFSWSGLTLGGVGDLGADDTYWWAAASQLGRLLSDGALGVDFLWNGFFVPESTPKHPDQVLTQVGYPLVILVLKILGVSDFLSLPFINAALDSLLIPIGWRIVKLSGFRVAEGVVFWGVICCFVVSDGLVHGATGYRDSHLAVIFASIVLVTLSRSAFMWARLMVLIGLLYLYRHAATVVALVPLAFMVWMRGDERRIRRLLRLIALGAVVFSLLMSFYNPAREQVVSLALGTALQANEGEVQGTLLTMVSENADGPLGLILLVAASIPLLVLRVPVDPGVGLLPLFFTGAVKYIFVTPIVFLGLWRVLSSLRARGGVFFECCSLYGSLAVAYVLGVIIFIPIAVLSGPRHLYFMVLVEFLLFVRFFDSMPRLGLYSWLVLSFSHVAWFFASRIA